MEVKKSKFFGKKVEIIFEDRHEIPKLLELVVEDQIKNMVPLLLLRGCTGVKQVIISKKVDSDTFDLTIIGDHTLGYKDITVKDIKISVYETLPLVFKLCGIYGPIIYHTEITFTEPVTLKLSNLINDPKLKPYLLHLKLLETLSRRENLYIKSNLINTIFCYSIEPIISLTVKSGKLIIMVDPKHREKYEYALEMYGIKLPSQTSKEETENTNVNVDDKITVVEVTPFRI